MSNDKFSIDDESVNRIAEAVNKINKNKSDSNQTPLDPYIQDLIPWLQNIDKRRVTICNGCGNTFIANKVGQKSCSNVCRNAAWREATGYEPNREYKKLGKTEKISPTEKRKAEFKEYVNSFIDSEHPNDKGRD